MSGDATRYDERGSDDKRQAEQKQPKHVAPGIVVQFLCRQFAVGIYPSLQSHQLTQASIDLVLCRDNLLFQLCHGFIESLLPDQYLHLGERSNVGLAMFFQGGVSDFAFWQIEQCLKHSMFLPRQMNPTSVNPGSGVSQEGDWSTGVSLHRARIPEAVSPTKGTGVSGQPGVDGVSRDPPQRHRTRCSKAT